MHGVAKTDAAQDMLDVLPAWLPLARKAQTSAYFEAEVDRFSRVLQVST